MHEGPDEEAENAHSLRLRRENQPARRSAANAENIAHCRSFSREDQTPQRSAAAIRKSSQIPPAVPAPTIWSGVTRSQCKASAEALTAAAEDPYSYVEAMDSPQ